MAKGCICLTRENRDGQENKNQTWRKNFATLPRNISCFASCFDDVLSFHGQNHTTNLVFGVSFFFTNFPLTSNLI